MADLTSLDVRYLAKELSSLDDAKIEKIVQGENKRDVLFTLYKRDMPKIHLRFLLPGMICSHPVKPDAYPKVPPGFAMFLRKYLGGARMKEVRQKGFDRVLEFVFTKKGAELTLVVELLAPGNMILVVDGNIKGLLETQNFKDRKLRGGIAYEGPPATFDPEKASDEELSRMLTESDKKIVVALATVVGLGGVYAEEVCARAKVDKNKENVTKEEITTLVVCIRELFAETRTPHLDEKRAYPFEVRGTKPFDGMFLAALGTFAEEGVAEKKEIRSKKKSKDKLQTMLDAQEKQIKRMEKRSEESKAAAERIFEEYQLVHDILEAAKDAREKKQNVLKGLKKFPQVKNYIPKTGEVEVELD